ncbi:MAG: hypothetical protein LBT49_06995 [Prevotellaceae bacterium]|jgi:hypothetical protein|nr:hypothetical protein [Prevotellaceae bacterium]
MNATTILIPFIIFVIGMTISVIIGAISMIFIKKYRLCNFLLRGFIILLFMYFQRPISEFIICKVIHYQYLNEFYDVGKLDKTHIARIASIKKIETADGIDEIIKKGLIITDELLYYSLSGSGSQNPNTIADIGYGHCGNYSILFSAIANHYIRENNLSDKYEVKVLAVKDIWFNTFSLFGHHVSCVLNNKKAGERIHIDPTFYDFNRITLRSMSIKKKHK